jgi:hypothetical protein
MHYTWDLAYGVYSDNIIREGLKGKKLNIVKNPYPNKWFADPFILEEDSNNIQLLVEEFDYSIGRGRIARLLIEKKSNKIRECHIILDLPTHLSFPVIYRVNGIIYVHPENSASGTSYIYKYDRSADKLVEPKLMLEEPITDAIIRKDIDSYRLFATKIPNSNGCILHEYQSSSLFGPYKHVGQEQYGKNTARMAGMFLTAQNTIVRPAQDCFGDYGKAVIMYDGNKELCRIEPTSYKQAGIHTFNTLGNTFVIDIKKYDYPLIYKITRLIKK